MAADSPLARPLTCSKALAAKFNFADPGLLLLDNPDNPKTSDSAVLHQNGGDEQAHLSEQPQSSPVCETLSTVDSDVTSDQEGPGCQEASVHPESPTQRQEKATPGRVCATPPPAQVCSMIAQLRGSSAAAAQRPGGRPNAL